MVYPKDTRKKHQVLICDERGPPPYDISPNSLKFKNWHDEGFIMSPVRNQLLSTYCWAIAIAKAVEVAVNIANPRDKKQVSHQYLIDKVDQVKDDGIARLFEAWQYIKKYGICEEKDYPTNPAYERNDVQIEVEAEQKLKIFNFDESATVKEMQLIDQLNKGPVVATVKAYPSFNLWKANVEDDVYLGPTLDDKHRKHGKIPEHALLLTGYGQNKDGVPFFHCMNSAGTNWGYEGFGKIARHIYKEKGSFFTSYSYCEIPDIE